MNRTFRFALVFHVVVSSLSASAVKAESDQELLELVRAAHRAARESIQTFSCRVELAITVPQGPKPPITQSCSSRYWFSPQAMRAKISEDNYDSDVLWDNSERKHVFHGKNRTATAVRDGFTHRHVKRCDPFVGGLLVLFLPNTSSGYLPFEELVERATKFKKAERTRAGNKELIVVQLFFDSSEKNEQGANGEIYFDPNANYLVRKVVYSFPTHRFEQEVLEFKEYGPGLFFPEQVVGNTQKLPSKDMYSESKTNFSDVQINQVLPNDIFNFKYPHGISLRDKILGSEYQVDADGNQISPQTPFAHEPLPPAKFADELAPGTETQEEPRSATRWILPISLGALIVGGVAAFLRRRRRQTESA